MNALNEEAKFENTFIKFCRKSIENASIDFEREQIKRQNKELPLVELHPSKEMQLAIWDSHDERPPIFQLQGIAGAVDREQIHDAMHVLSELRQKIIMMYYFLNMSDREIGLLLNMNRRTVNFNRGSALVEMKYHLEALMYGT